MRENPSVRRILVTGGAGFIGSHLVARLAADGHNVHVVDDLSRGRRAWLHADVDMDVVDIRDLRALRHVVARVHADAVVHLAAMHFIPAVDGAPELAHDVNVNGTSALLQALKAAPPEQLLFASTAAVYPDRVGPIAETCAPAPLDVYGETKLEGERLVDAFASTGADVVVARIFNVIGRRETNAHVVPELVGQLRGGARRVHLGNLEPRRDYTDVRDVADALARLLAIRSHKLGAVNIGSGRGVSVADLVEACERILNRPIEIEVEPGRRRSRDRHELIADSTLLRSVTGWAPMQTLDETLADLLTAPTES
jgi:UDP-glucose 4-epimerase